LSKADFVVCISQQVSFKHVRNLSLASFDFKTFFKRDLLSDDVSSFFFCAARQVLVAMPSLQISSGLVAFLPDDVERFHCRLEQ
jgi:hypothetical protein